VAYSSKENLFFCQISRDNNKDAFGHWFYFEVTGLDKLAHFRILPFRKRKSLYE
jgi:hypothetical protein